MPNEQPSQSCMKCSEPAVARRLCKRHDAERYVRVRCCGPRPDDWGSRSKHPLYKTWTGTRRWNTQRDPAWDDFLAFVRCVGERPSEHHRLAKIEPSKPLGPNNWQWRELIAPSEDTRTKAGRAAWQRTWRKKNKKVEKRIDLRRRFNISERDYDAMLEAQGGVCAICRRECEHFALAVDHCHETKQIRGLLCASCNLGLGKFKDDPDRLEAAATYLRRARQPKLRLVK